MKKILIFLASQNKNKELAEAILKSLKNNTCEVEIIDLVDMDLPLYSSKKQAEQGVPQGIADLFNECQAANRFIFISPEYNGGIPPVLTNVLAWLSVMGKNWRDAFNRKVAGIATFSGGEGMQLIIGLRSQLAYVGLTVIGRSLQVNYNKPLKPESLADFTDQLMSSF